MDNIVSRARDIAAKEEFSEQMKNASCVEDFRKAFADNGLELSEQELIQTMDELSDSQMGELDEEQLDEASGGSLAARAGLMALSWAWRMVRRTARPTGGNGAFGGGSGVGFR